MEIKLVLNLVFWLLVVLALPRRNGLSHIPNK